MRNIFVDHIGVLVQSLYWVERDLTCVDTTFVKGSEGSGVILGRDVSFLSEVSEFLRLGTSEAHLSLVYESLTFTAGLHPH